MNPTLSFYENNAATLIPAYDKIWMNHFYTLVNVKPGEVVLDVGAGSGRDSSYFINQGCIVDAIEPVDSFQKEIIFKMSNSCPPETKGQHRLIPKDVITYGNLWLNNRSHPSMRMYDLIWCCASLQHLENHAELLQALFFFRKALKKYGRIFVSFKRTSNDDRFVLNISPKDLLHDIEIMCKVKHTFFNLDKDFVSMYLVDDAF